MVWKGESQPFQERNLRLTDSEVGLLPMSQLSWHFTIGCFQQRSATSHKVFLNKINKIKPIKRYRVSFEWAARNSWRRNKNRVASWISFLRILIFVMSSLKLCLWRGIFQIMKNKKWLILITKKNNKNKSKSFEDINKFDKNQVNQTHWCCLLVFYF